MTKGLDTTFMHEKAKELKAFLLERVVGQERAINATVQAFNLSLSPVKENLIFVGLFLGPSGVGKTMLAEKLAEFFFEDDQGLTTVNGESITQPHELSRLIGSPPGYIGYTESALFAQEMINAPAIKHFLKRLSADHPYRKLKKELRTLERTAQERIERASTPFEAQKILSEIKSKKDELGRILKNALKEHILYSVVLVDEIEKADRSLANFLLGIMQTGRVHLANGSTTTFNNTFLIITGNVGSEDIAAYLADTHIGFSARRAKTPDDDSEKVYTITMEKVKRRFSSEFIGRIDEIIVFRPHNAKNFQKIFDLSIDEMTREYGKKDFPLRIAVTEAARAFILQKASDHPELGARLLKKKLRRYIKEPIANIVASGNVKKNDTVSVDLSDETIFFHVQNDPS